MGHQLRSMVSLTTIFILGRPVSLIKEILIAAYFGAGLGRDAFLIAWLIPNLLGSLLTEGFPQLFIPFYTKLSSGHKDLSARVLSSLLNYLLLILIFISCLIIYTAPVLVSLVAPKITLPVHKLAVKLTYLTGFTVLFSGLSAFLTSLLQVNKKFILPGLTVPLMNLAVIMFIWVGNVEWGIYSLAGGVLTGTCLMVVLQLFSWSEVGFKYTLTWELPVELKNFFQLSGMFLWGTLIFNFNSIIDRFFASSLAVGTISCLDYGFRLVQMIFTAFVPSITTVIFPQMSKLAPTDESELVTMVEKGFKAVLLILIPVTFIFYFYRIPVVQLIYQHGVFDVKSTYFTAQITGIYTLGLIPHGINWLFLYLTFALKKMYLRTRFAILFVLCNFIFNFLLVRVWGGLGIAWANTLSAYCGMIFFLFIYRQIFPNRLRMSLFNFSVKIIVMSCLAMIPVYFSSSANTYFKNMSGIGTIVIYVIGLSCGGIIFFYLGSRWRISEWEPLKKIFSLPGWINQR